MKYLDILPVPTEEVGMKKLHYLVSFMEIVHKDYYIQYPTSNNNYPYYTKVYEDAGWAIDYELGNKSILFNI